MQLKAHAPGSLMLLGEYAVLHDYPALVAAINQRLRVELTPKREAVLSITSDRYGAYEAPLSALTAVDDFNFVIETVKLFKDKMSSGLELTITSDFSGQIGFGSSAALVVATLAALNAWLQLQLSPLEMVRFGRQIVQKVQGTGSGADIAASVYGGIIAYRKSPLFVRSFAKSHPLVAYYSGFKTKTAQAILEVTTRFQPYPHVYSALLQAIGECAETGIHYLEQNDWPGLGKLFTVSQGLMEALGVSLPILQQMVAQLNSIPGIFGAKISGAGLGDCVIGLGEAHNSEFESLIPIAMSEQGVVCERIR